MYIYKKSLEDGRVPNDWKNANVTAIFKKGNNASHTARATMRVVSGERPSLCLQL